MNIHKEDHPKIPRWISTDDGKWAWVERLEWRRSAANALSVQERALLLTQAAQLRAAEPRRT